MGSSRTGDDREADALVAQIAQLRARIEEARERRTSARASSENEEMAALRERIAVAKERIARQSSAPASVERQARRTRRLVGIGLSVAGAILVGGFWRVEHRHATTEEGLGWFYLLFALPLLMGVVLILQSRYSAFRNGSLDADDS